MPSTDTLLEAIEKLSIDQKSPVLIERLPCGCMLKITDRTSPRPLTEFIFCSLQHAQAIWIHWHTLVDGIQGES